MSDAVDMEEALRLARTFLEYEPERKYSREHDARTLHEDRSVLARALIEAVRERDEAWEKRRLYFSERAAEQRVAEARQAALDEVSAWHEEKARDGLERAADAVARGDESGRSYHCAVGNTHDTSAEAIRSGKAHPAGDGR